MHRVRTLIPYLDYTPLRKQKILPKQALFTKIPRGGKFPSIAAKMGYSKFGLYMETVIKASLTRSGKVSLKDYTEVKNLVCEHFKSPNDVVYEPEWSCSPVAGHPDLVYQDCVYDIKTTGRFNAMRSETILQVLSYFCLAQKLGKSITKIGLVLPAQRLILTYDLSEWKWEPFWKELVDCVPLKQQRESLYRVNPVMLVSYSIACKQARVGTHISKLDLIQNIPYGRALQFFVAGRASSKIDLTSIFKKKLKEAVIKNSVNVFIHSSYILNLSKPCGNFKRKGDSDTPWVCEKLQTLLQLGSECQLKGIVIHCGKVGGLEMSDAITAMHESVELAVEGCSVGCPLLIETSSGQGGEILCSPEELSSFWLSLSSKAKKVVSICVDTCHVFAAGYNPIEFILYLESAGVPIALIHYNDSKCKKGSKKDRHAPIGHGYIGFEPLVNVLTWAHHAGVPLLME